MVDPGLLKSILETALSDVDIEQDENKINVRFENSQGMISFAHYEEDGWFGKVFLEPDSELIGGIPINVMNGFLINNLFPEWPTDPPRSETSENRALVFEDPDAMVEAAETVQSYDYT